MTYALCLTFIHKLQEYSPYRYLAMVSHEGIIASESCTIEVNLLPDKVTT
jgi:hypothetical protein